MTRDDSELGYLTIFLNSEFELCYVNDMLRSECELRYLIICCPPKVNLVI